MSAFPRASGSRERHSRCNCNIAVMTQPLLMKVPSRSLRAACRSSACVFITIGPYQAMGSRSGRPETSNNRNSLFASLGRGLIATGKATSGYLLKLSRGRIVIRPTGCASVLFGHDRVLRADPLLFRCHSFLLGTLVAQSCIFAAARQHERTGKPLGLAGADARGCRLAATLGRVRDCHMGRW